MKRLLLFLLLVMASACTTKNEQHFVEDDKTEPLKLKGINIYDENPFYWQYQGKPILLIGGSNDDNIMHLPDWESHIDSMKQAGANYIRCTLSSRDPGNEWPFEIMNGKYNLKAWNSDYWENLDSLFMRTQQEEIIVQLELWATWDFYKASNTWQRHPFNPKNNINYNSKRSGLDTAVDYFPFEKIQPFFKSIPALNDESTLMFYQEKFINHVLWYSLHYDHILYCIDNETCASPEWGKYWANYIKQKAKEKDKKILVTEMWDDWDPSEGEVKTAVSQDSSTHPYLDRARVLETAENIELYDFLDISNHNVQNGETHYKTGLWVRNFIANSGFIRPINCVKIYGGVAQTNFDGTYEQGQQRFWRNVFAGIASVRFHRPPAGIGLDSVSFRHIKSMNMFVNSFPLFSSSPDNTVLFGRKANEAFCLTDGEKHFAVYFPAGGETDLKLPRISKKITLKWLNIMQSKWENTSVLMDTENINLKAPSNSHWLALIQIN